MIKEKYLQIEADKSLFGTLLRWNPWHRNFVIILLWLLLTLWWLFDVNIRWLIASIQ